MRYPEGATQGSPPLAPLKLKAEPRSQQRYFPTINLSHDRCQYALKVAPYHPVPKIQFAIPHIELLKFRFKINSIVKHEILSVYGVP